MSTIGQKVKEYILGKKPPQRPKYDPMICTLDGCGEKKNHPHDLTCQRHWNLVPANLKRVLWKAEKIRSPQTKEREVLAAAQAILDYLEAEVIRGADPQSNLVKP